MDYKVFSEKYIHCCRLITEKRLREAFILLQELAEESHNIDYLNQLENHRETYRNILKYSFGEVEDPQKKEVYFRLLRSVLRLADALFETIVVSRRMVSYAPLKRELESAPLFSGTDPLRILGELEWTPSLNAFPEAENTDEAIDAGLRRNEQEQLVQKVFHALWLTDIYGDQEMEFLHHMIASEELPWYFKSLFISAVTLSAQRFFDISKLEILADAFLAGENQVRQRALTGLIILLYQYRERLSIYPQSETLIRKIREGNQTDQQIEAIVIQLIKAKDTEKITQKFRDEVLPEITRLQSRIYEKLDLQNLMKDPFAEDKNPDWENVFHDTPTLYNKLEEFSMLQLEGGDVFMGTFSMLKHFDFFHEISNWFLPFYKENSRVKEALAVGDDREETDKLAEGLEKSILMCNSDKYSFCLNVKRMPEVQRRMMFDMVSMELRAVEELAQDDELLAKPTADRVVYTQYIQDLYRFYKLYQYKTEFYDVFATPFDIYQCGFFRELLPDTRVIRNIGEFYFEKEHYSEAAQVFMLLDNEPMNFELWQKIGYSFQKLGNYAKALEYYRKADLSDLRKAWNTKKIAFCYRKLGEFRKALEYYHEAEKLEPDNLYIQASLGHTYFDLKEYEEALKYYFKVEFLSPDDHRIQRPIAWCSFVLGKLDTAKKYFEKVTGEEGNQHDLLNLGHVEWCLGNKTQAIEYYRKSIRKADYNFDWFAKEFIADADLLQKFGIDPIDIPLMRDYLKILIESEF